MPCREQQTDPKDRTIARLLLDAPALPQPAVAQFLADVAAGGDEWATLALSVGILFHTHMSIELLGTVLIDKEYSVPTSAEEIEPAAVALVRVL